jgi:hypothetical protein
MTGANGEKDKIRSFSMRAHPYREKRRIRHDRRVAARLKRKMLAEEERSGLSVPTSVPTTSVPMVLHPAGLPMVIEPTILSTLATPATSTTPATFTLQLPRLEVLKPSPLKVYSTEDLRRLELTLRKRTRHRQQFFLPAPEMVRRAA